MILDRIALTHDDVEILTGWSIRPEGACKDGQCVPLDGIVADSGHVDMTAFARRLGMPLVHDARHGLWCIGPRAGGRALQDARMPKLVLPDIDGTPFDIASLRGLKVLLLAWSSW
jgi:hypothetical protein